MAGNHGWELMRDIFLHHLICVILACHDVSGMRHEDGCRANGRGKDHPRAQCVSFIYCTNDGSYGTHRHIGLRFMHISKNACVDPWVHLIDTASLNSWGSFFSCTYLHRVSYLLIRCVYVETIDRRGLSFPSLPSSQCQRLIVVPTRPCKKLLAASTRTELLSSMPFLLPCLGLAFLHVYPPITLDFVAHFRD